MIRPSAYLDRVDEGAVHVKQDALNIEFGMFDGVRGRERHLFGGRHGGTLFVTTRCACSRLKGYVDARVCTLALKVQAEREERAVARVRGEEIK